MNANLLFNIMPDILANVIAHTLYMHIKTKLSLIVDYYLPIKLYLNKNFHFITEFSKMSKVRVHFGMGVA